jgi:hypothetical protein
MAIDFSKQEGVDFGELEGLYKGGDIGIVSNFRFNIPAHYSHRFNTGWVIKEERGFAKFTEDDIWNFGLGYIRVEGELTCEDKELYSDTGISFFVLLDGERWEQYLSMLAFREEQGSYLITSSGKVLYKDVSGELEYTLYEGVPSRPRGINGKVLKEYDGSSFEEVFKDYVNFLLKQKLERAGRDCDIGFNVTKIGKRYCKGVQGSKSKVIFEDSVFYYKGINHRGHHYV